MPRDPKGKPEKEEELDEVPQSPMRYGWFGTLLIASWRMWKMHWGVAVSPFLVLASALTFAPFLLYAIEGSSADRTVGTIVFYVLPLMIPLAGAWITARVSLLTVSSGDDRRKSFRATGETTKLMRPHIATAAMVATALALLIGYALQPIGPIVVPFIFLGPPILIQIIAVEEQPFTEAWARTKVLVRGEVARFVVYLISIALAMAFLYIIARELVGLSLVSSPLGDVPNAIVFLIANVVLIALPLSFMVCVGMAGYIELKERQEAKAT